MLLTCKIKAEVYVNDKLVNSKEWPVVDIMKTSYTRGWCTREFNLHWNYRKPDIPIRVYWEQHGPHEGDLFRGTLSGVNNVRFKRGIFED